MRKQILLASIANTCVWLVNLVVYFSLDMSAVIVGTYMSYLIQTAFLICTWIPFALHLLFKLKFSLPVILAYHIFLVVAITIGSVWKVYDLWAYYDVVVHFSSGVVISLICYSLFSNTKNNKLGYLWLFVLVVSVAMCAGGIWEIWEFSTDAIFHNNAQRAIGFVGREAVFDTMFDLICDFCGALLGGTVAMFIEKFKRKKASTEDVVEYQADKIVK